MTNCIGTGYFKIFLNINPYQYTSFVFSPLNGKNEVVRMKMMTPRLQLSILCEYGNSNTISGAVYIIVPQTNSAFYVGIKKVLNPKSQIFIVSP